MIGLQQPLVVQAEGERYRLIAGHRRRNALALLARETAPCIVLAADLDPAIRTLILHWTNTMARGGAGLKGDALAGATKEIESALTDLKKRGVVELPGKLREYVAGLLQVSESAVARAKAIDAHLIQEWKDIYGKNCINDSVAYELSQCDAVLQLKLHAVYKSKTWQLDAKKVKAHKKAADLGESIGYRTSWIFVDDPTRYRSPDVNDLFARADQIGVDPQEMLFDNPDGAPLRTLDEQMRQAVADPQPSPIWHPYPAERPAEGQTVLTRKSTGYYSALWTGGRRSWRRRKVKMKSEPMNLNEVATEDLVAMLRHVSVETGSLACLGCGHEHNCGTRGCALIREAADRLDALRGPAIIPQAEMTREEAIIIIERVAHTEAKWPGTEDTLEALNMAVSALRPVSREQAEKFKEYFDDLYGKGLEVYGWHMNGEAKSFDDFYEDACEYAGL